MISFWEVVQSTAGAGAPTALVTLPELKLALDITGTSEDVALQARIDRVSEAMATALDRTLAQTEVVETFIFDVWEGFDFRRPLLLSFWPVVEVYDVMVDGASVTDYELDAINGRLLRTNSGRWNGRVEVFYLGGYLLPDEAPAALSAAVIEAVRQGRSFSSADPTVRSVQHGDVSIGFYSSPQQQGSHGLPASVIADIASFRRITV